MAARPWQSLTDLSEDELRLQVILPLLAGTERLSSITDVHGRNEKGLDVIFFEDGPIQTICYGMQIKRRDISGGGTGRRTVKEIIDQLEIAKDLEHPIIVGRQGRFQIDRFIVVTGGKISDTARDEIASRLKRMPVLFWDGNEIERRIRKYLPELFSAADGTTIAYLKAIIPLLDTLDSLDQIPGVARRTLTQVYEP